MILELSDAQKAFGERVAAFAADRVAPVAATIDETAAFPGGLIQEAATLGLMGVTIATEWGGAGLDYVSYAVALEALARSSAVVAVIAAVNNSLVAEPLAEFGTDAQKQTWLRRLAAGEAIGAFGLSETDAGSDAANQPHRRAARRSRLRDQRPQGLGRQCRSGRSGDPVRRDAARDSRPRHQRVSGPDRHARADARRVGRFARRARAGLHGSRADQRAGGSRFAARPAGRRIPDRDVGARRRAGSRLPRRRSASEPRRSTKRCATPGLAKRSASRSATTRRSSGCSPTRPPSSMRRGC